MAGFVISRAQLEDVPVIHAIQAECGLSEWSASAYREEIGRPDSIVLTARSTGDDLVGFLAGRIIPGEHASKPEAEIYNIGVRPGARLQGVGSGLLLNFIESCRKADVSCVWLDVRVSNQAAISFYLAHGFEAVGRRLDFYRAPVEDSEIMVTRLSGRGQEQSGEDA